MSDTQKAKALAAEKGKTAGQSGKKSHWSIRLSRTILQTILPLAVIAGGFSVYKYLQATKPEVPERKAREKVWPVETRAVKFSNYQPILRHYGETVAGRRVELRALVSGEVIETGKKLKDGAEIDKGDLILRIDPFNYEGALTEAQANLTEAKAKLNELHALIAIEKEALQQSKEQLRLAQRDLERAIPLSKKGTVSQKTADDRRLVVSQRKLSVEQATNNLDLQKARVEQQKAVIARLNWRVTLANRQLTDTKLKAPFNAFIASVDAEEGRLVGANDRVATLIDKSWIDIRFNLTDRQYGRILAAEGSVIGRAVKANWYVGPTPLTYQAMIERVSAEITSENGGVTVFARITTPNKPAQIRTGAFVEILVPDRSYQNVAQVPQTALYGQNKVYVVQDDRLQSREVEVVGSEGDLVLIRGNLNEGDHVMITRLTTAGPGVKVKAFPAQTDKKPQDPPAKSQSDPNSLTGAKPNNRAKTKTMPARSKAAKQQKHTPKGTVLQ